MTEVLFHDPQAFFPSTFHFEFHLVAVGALADGIISVNTVINQRLIVKIKAVLTPG